MSASIWQAAFVTGCLEEIIESTPGLSRVISYVREGDAKAVDAVTLARTTPGGGAVPLTVIRLDFESRPVGAEGAGGEGEEEAGFITWLAYKPSADASGVLGPDFLPRGTDQVIDAGITYQVDAWDFTPGEQAVFICGTKIGTAC